ncbi:MAG: hypothetical protein ACREQL_14815 [Candidatus Binatia bacterium]
MTLFLLMLPGLRVVAVVALLRLAWWAIEDLILDRVGLPLVDAVPVRERAETPRGRSGASRRTDTSGIVRAW